LEKPGKQIIDQKDRGKYVGIRFSVFAGSTQANRMEKMNEVLLYEVLFIFYPLLSVLPEPLPPVSASFSDERD
jgi:hypothetical protein